MSRASEFQRRLTERMEANRAARHVRWDADISANRRAAPGTEFPVLVDAADVEPMRLVYGLADPRDPKRIRYVGQTATGAFARYLGHLADAGIGVSAKAQWIERLRGEGVYPTMVLLELAAPDANILSLESWWIRSLKERGEADLNAARNSRRNAPPTRGGFPDLAVAPPVSRTRTGSPAPLDPRQHQRPRAGGVL